jgi:hypothetical protein
MFAEIEVFMDENLDLDLIAPQAKTITQQEIREQKRLEQLKLKVLNRELNILKDSEEERLKSAERIAQKLLARNKNS